MFGSPNPLEQSASSPFGSAPFGNRTLPSKHWKPASSASSNPAFGSSSSSFTAFGESASSAFGFPSVFGQPENFTFGSTTPFQAPTGGSLFDGTSSTGLFGTTSSSASASSLNATSSPAFRNSTPAFSTSSNPASGSSSLSFAGSSMFGQKPIFGGFGSRPNQPITFGSASQQTQSNFGSTVFGVSTPFGTSSQPAFAAASAHVATSTAAFGVTTTPVVCSSLTSTFGSTGTTFGVSSAPAFRSGGGLLAPSTLASDSSGTPAFETSNASLFGHRASSAPVFETPRIPAFGTPRSPAIASSTQGFRFDFSTPSIPNYSQSTSAAGSNSSIGTTLSPFVTQTPLFGDQKTLQASERTGISQSAFGDQCRGSRVATYTATVEDSGSSILPAGELQSISAMPLYKDKSHEELRWEGYQLENKGRYSPAFGTPSTTGFGASSTAGLSFPSFPKESLFRTTPSPFGTQTSSFGVQSPAVQSASGMDFNASTTQTNPIVPSTTFCQPFANPFSSSTTCNPFPTHSTAFSFPGSGMSSTPVFSSPCFIAPSSGNPFGTISPFISPFIIVSPPAFATFCFPYLFGTSSSPGFASSPSIFCSSSVPGTPSGFSLAPSFISTQAYPVFQGSSPGQTNAPCGQSSSSFGPGTAPSSS